MKIKTLLIFRLLFILTIGLQGCDQSEELSFKDLDTSPGYFVECYLTPGEVYKLSATRISPLSDDYILDYSADFDVTIDSLTLFHSLYSENGSNYIYNFGNAEEFAPAKTTDTVRLQVINAENDTLRSFTTVPDSIQLINATIDDDILQISLTLSERPIHNYYLLKIEFFKQNEETSSDLKFYDLSKTGTDQSELEIGYNLPMETMVKSLKLELFRVTEANYKYQLSLWNAENANDDNLVFPNPLDGNIENGIGIFTCYSKKEFSMEL
jgi:hypothetical protein